MAVRPVLFSLGFLLGLTAPSPPAAAGPLSVFVSVLPQKYFAERLAEKRAVVTVMVGPGQSPATYEPTPKQMAKLADAGIFFAIGVPFEGVWLDRIAAVNRDMRIVHTEESLPRLKADAGDASHGHGGTDPHVWTSPLNAKKLAGRMRDAFIAADGGNRGAYEENYRRLAEDLDRLDADIRLLLDPLEGRAFMVFHPSWGHFADAYGLKQIPIESGGSEPGARYLAETIDTARREGITVVFVQRQFSRRAAESVARAVGGRVVVVDPLAEDYLDNMRAVAALFAESLR